MNLFVNSLYLSNLFRWRYSNLSDDSTKKNHIVSVHGRGANHCFMINGETQDVANRCQVAVDAGFEVWIYLIEASNMGQPAYTPTGSLNLRRVYHLYDAMEKYHDEIHSTIESLDAHSLEASKKYITHMIEQLQAEAVKLNEMDQPTTGS